MCCPVKAQEISHIASMGPHFSIVCNFNPDTSPRQQGGLPHVPVIVALAPSMLRWKSQQFPHYRVPLTNEKMPWCPCPFEKEAQHTGLRFNPHKHTHKSRSKLMVTSFQFHAIIVLPLYMKYTFLFWISVSNFHYQTGSTLNTKSMFPSIYF